MNSSSLILECHIYIVPYEEETMAIQYSLCALPPVLIVVVYSCPGM